MSFRRDHARSESGWLWAPPFLDPAGRAHMTMGDWAKFVSAHLRGDPKNPTRESILLKAETYETLHRPIDNYAMGWQVIPHPVPPGMKFFDKSGDVYEGAILTHNGTNTRWFADVWLFPELNLGY